jgi:DNA helicase TIP49 (TBP-interacting protein)
MSQLEALGAAVLHRNYKSSSTSINGMQLSSGETTELTIKLPRAVAIKARFTKEGIVNKLGKIFKKELQTGDGDFDRAVFISTDTPDDTAKLLASDDIRALIKLNIETGGPIEIDGEHVKIEVLGRQDGDDAAATNLVRALLG